MKYYDLEERWGKHFEKKVEKFLENENKMWMSYTYISKLPSGNLLILFGIDGIRLHNSSTGECMFYFDAIGTNREAKGLDSGLYLELL